MVATFRLTTLAAASAVDAADLCSFDGPFPNMYLSGCAKQSLLKGCESFGTLEEAQKACVGEATCFGITENKDKQFELRAGRLPQGPSPSGETSWLLGDLCRGNPKIWPVPASWTAGMTTLAVQPSESFFHSDGLPETLKKAFGRIASKTFPHRVDAQDGGMAQISVSVDDTDESHPQAGHDESYSLDISETGEAKLHAKTIWGALHGLETFSQLVSFDFDSGSYKLAHAPWTIRDAPRFPWRGLMVDTSRHFQPIPALQAMIDSLTYAKVNVLHWHMSDTQSFPMESKSRPKLWQGAHSTMERYTQRDIADLIEYARERGVRVMVEFDMPGHAAAWCQGYPEVCPATDCLQPLNVANNATFDLITDLLSEMSGGKPSGPGAPAGLFPDNYIHLGGDEVNTACWTKSPSISKWLSDQSMSADDGYAYFVKRASDIALSVGRRPVQWVEVFDHFGSKLDNRTVIHVWKDKSTLKDVVAAGYNAILDNSPGSDSWYLDHLSVSWDAVYGNEPCSEITDEECKLVLGGQGEMWGETVDISDLESTVWPRMAAIAERLWSPRNVTDQQDAEARLENFRCLLNQRGVRSAPLTSGHARSAPPNPGSCFQTGGGILAGMTVLI